MEVTYSNEQFYMIILLITWLFLILKMEDDKLFGIFQLFIGMPLSLWIFGIAYWNTLTYGYLIGGAFMFTALLCFVSILWHKNKK
jgi:hypothetical protein